MKRTNGLVYAFVWGLVISTLAVLPYLCQTNKAYAQSASQDSTLSIIQQIVEATPYCALITEDAQGNPVVRTMEPFPPEEGMVIWLATNPKSRKVAHIKRNSDVVLHYIEQTRPAYVTVYGSAELVNEAEEKKTRWKESWEAFYPDRENGYLLIRVIPTRIEVVSAADGMLGDSITWHPPVISLDQQ